ncbi:GNAT family N-acetyltransferase [Ferdinandcohnia sp. SAFN-114]|uniref:GNAT family N-acetyltransferase n=1 Tax=Ferdinandcohnia sp. SAFN-114 TaxID=3387275 RepID=UPI003F803F4B
MEIRVYENTDEISWLRCRVLAFLDTAYYDNVLKEKEKYDNPAIELVAIENGKVIGLLDIEYETEERTVCSRGSGLGGMIWHLAVHPDYRRKGIGAELLRKAVQIAKTKNLNRLEAWTRDDNWVRKWYETSGFLKVNSYFHVYLEGQEGLETKIPNLKPVYSFAHYLGKDLQMIKNKFSRVHECICYEKTLK